MSDILLVALDALQQSGDYLKQQFLKRHTLTIKPDDTELLGEDMRSEEIIMQAISTHFSTDSFLTEEADTEIISNNVWVIDPLCGTYSYLRGVETWSVSLALIRDGIYEFGGVYQPLLGNRFYSLKGRGAFLNKQQIRLSAITDIANSFISVEFAALKSKKLEVQNLVQDVKRIRVAHGSGGELAYVAAGFIDGLIKTDQSLMHFAGGRAIVEEAGAAFIDFTGNPAPTYFRKDQFTDYIAANKEVAQALLKYVSETS